MQGRNLGTCFKQGFYEMILYKDRSTHYVPAQWNEWSWTPNWNLFQWSRLWKSISSLGSELLHHLCPFFSESARNLENKSWFFYFWVQTYFYINTKKIFTNPFTILRNYFLVITLQHPKPFVVLQSSNWK